MSDFEPTESDQAPWGASENLEFYSAHRSEPDDLYPSERLFLPDVLRRVEHVLDVGCAAGGFSTIMRSFNPSIQYTGVDIRPEFIDLARRRYPDSQFAVCAGARLPFPAGSFDMVHSSGVLHMNAGYRDIVRAMWNQTRRFVLCDFRLTPGKPVDGQIAVSGAMLPYVVVNVDELLAFLQSLEPRPSAITAKGYWHAVASSVRIDVDRAIMAFFLIEKGVSDACTMTIDFDVPVEENKES